MLVVLSYIRRFKSQDIILYLCGIYLDIVSSDMVEKLRVLELFSGIGGMHHALNLLGDVEVSGFCNFRLKF